jgi:hypothetical protein
MLKDTVWAETGLGPDGGVLCLDHIEARLGRRLQPDDFKPGDGYWGGLPRMLPFIRTPLYCRYIRELKRWCHLLRRCAFDEAAAVAFIEELRADLWPHLKPIDHELLVDLWHHLDLVAEAVP